MTRKEVLGHRDLTFSQWIRNKLPDSKTGFWVTDLDFILCNYKTKKVMLLEVKTYNKQLPKWQRLVFKNLHKWLKRGITEPWQYLGFHLVKLENNNPATGRILLDNKKVTESELIKFLSF